MNTQLSPPPSVTNPWVGYHWGFEQDSCIGIYKIDPGTKAEKSICYYSLQEHWDTKICLLLFLCSRHQRGKASLHGLLSGLYVLCTQKQGIITSEYILWLYAFSVRLGLKTPFLQKALCIFHLLLICFGFVSPGNIWPRLHDHVFPSSKMLRAFVNGHYL